MLLALFFNEESYIKFIKTFLKNKRYKSAFSGNLVKNLFTTIVKKIGLRIIQKKENGQEPKT